VTLPFILTHDPSNAGPSHVCAPSTRLPRLAGPNHGRGTLSRYFNRYVYRTNRVARTPPISCTDGQHGQNERGDRQPAAIVRCLVVVDWLAPDRTSPLHQHQHQQRDERVAARPDGIAPRPAMAVSDPADSCETAAGVAPSRAVTGGGKRRGRHLGVVRKNAVDGLCYGVNECGMRHTSMLNTRPTNKTIRLEYTSIRYWLVCNVSITGSSIVANHRMFQGDTNRCLLCCWNRYEVLLFTVPWNVRPWPHTTNTYRVDAMWW